MWFSRARESLVVHPWQEPRPQSDTKQFLSIRVNTGAEIVAHRQSFLLSSHFERASQMTSGENIDLNWNACLGLSKSAASPPLQENNRLFCRSLGKCHYSSCLGPRARHSHSAGCWNLQKHAPAPRFLKKMLIFLLIYSKCRHNSELYIMM